MDEQPLGTLTYNQWKADVYSMSMPGEFTVVYRNPAGEPVEETPVTGISSYKQRETEILEKLKNLCDGKKPESPSDRGDAGEY